MILIVVEMMHAGVVRVQNMGVLDILQKIYANVMINALIMVIVVMIMKNCVLVEIQVVALVQVWHLFVHLRAIILG